jgi:hypothetical protein
MQKVDILICEEIFYLIKEYLKLKNKKPHEILKIESK